MSEVLEPAKLVMVENNVNDIAVTELSEIRWKETGYFTTSNSNLII